MPKKGKKGKKGKKEAKDDDQSSETGGAAAAGQPTEKEVILQRELDELTAKLAEMKEKQKTLGAENDFLQQEANKIRIENHEYMNYIEKKANKRQTNIISLSDHNSKVIDDLANEKVRILEEFERRKGELNKVLMEKEANLMKKRAELEELASYKELRQDQLNKIKSLEVEVMKQRHEQTEKLQQRKAQFLREKQQIHVSSESKINEMGKQANKEAEQQLLEYSLKTRMENRRLRQQLLALIQKNRAIHDRIRELQSEQQQLIAEEKLAVDMRTIKRLQYKLTEDADASELQSSPIGQYQ